MLLAIAIVSLSLAVVTLIYSLFGDEPFNFDFGSAVVAIMSWWVIWLPLGIILLCIFGISFILYIIDQS